MQAVHIDIFGPGLRSSIRPAVPLLDQLFEIVLHVGFELCDALDAECVGDGLAFAGVLGAITGIEEAALDGDEGVVIFTGFDGRGLARASSGSGMTRDEGVPLQPTSTMAVDDTNGFWVRDGDVIGLYSHEWAIFLVGFVDSEEAAPSSALVEEPEVAEGCELGAWDVSNRIVAEVGEEVVEDWEEEESPRREKLIEKHGCEGREKRDREMLEQHGRHIQVPRDQKNTEAVAEAVEGFALYYTECGIVEAVKLAERLEGRAVYCVWGNPRNDLLRGWPGRLSPECALRGTRLHAARYDGCFNCCREGNKLIKYEAE